MPAPAMGCAKLLRLCHLQRGALCSYLVVAALSMPSKMQLELGASHCCAAKH